MPDFEATLIELSRLQRAAWVAASRRARGTYDEPQGVQVMFVSCHPSTARRRYPGAIVCRVCGGSAVFFTATDWRTWRNQR